MNMYNSSLILMEFFYSTACFEPSEYSTQLLTELKNKRMGKFNNEGFKKFRSLAASITLSTNHMMRAIDVQLYTYKNVKSSGASWNNESALINFYNGLSELQAVCATFIFERSVEIDQIIGGERLTFMMPPFPHDGAFIVYLGVKSKEVLTGTCIDKGPKLWGAEKALIDLKELSRLLKRRRKISYPEDYCELVKKCKEEYFILTMNVEGLQ